VLPFVQSLSFEVPCGGPKVDVQLRHDVLSPTLSPFVSYRAPFDLAAVSPSCYKPMNITLNTNVPTAPFTSVTRSRTFIRAPPPNTSDPAISTTVWQVDAETKAFRVDGRPFIAQGWFAGGYSHESVGLPPIMRVADGAPMTLNR
jgi:hypothetical protein